VRSLAFTQPLGRLRRRARKQWRGRVKQFRAARLAARDRLRALWRARFRATYRRSLAKVPVRAEIPHVLERRGLRGRGVEVGVAKGVYSALVLREWSGRELISIDPWYDRPENEAQARARLADFGARSLIWPVTSEEAAGRVGDRELDFAYIDAAHDYESVKQDLALWFPKVRPGGILAGHDYPEPGVRAAVDEFCAAHGLRVHQTGTEPAKGSRRKNPSWLLEVPR